jgi:hypothetical protein
LVHETAASKSRSRSRLLPPYRKSAGGHDDDEVEVEVEVEGDIVVEVEDDEGEEEGEEEEEINPRSSERPSSFSGRASNCLSSLGQSVPSRYPFAFRHPARGSSMSSTVTPLRLLACHCDTTKQEHLNPRVAREA